MNLYNVINEIEKIDPEVYERLDGRRTIVKSIVKKGGLMALSAVPIALGSLFSKAYGQTSSGQILDVLNFALTLEYLEAEFYNKGNASAGLIPDKYRPSFQVISDHENEHVQFLKTTVSALGGTPVSKPTFDFSAGKGSGTGPFAGVFMNFDLFLAVSQTFEDTGVRAYKGQAGNLISSNEVLRAALRIHSVEARHAAHVRIIRSMNPSALVVSDLEGMPDPWIPKKQSNIASPAVQPSYDGEELTTQAGIPITMINGFNVSDFDASEAFDEPLSKQQILSIVGPFIV